MQVAKNNLRPTIPGECPPPLAECISKCWSSQPGITKLLSLHSTEDRPTGIEVLRMLQDIKQDFDKKTGFWQACIRQRVQRSESSLGCFDLPFTGGRVPSAVEDLYMEMKTRSASQLLAGSNLPGPVVSQEDGTSPPKETAIEPANDTSTSSTTTKTLEITEHAPPEEDSDSESDKHE